MNRLIIYIFFLSLTSIQARDHRKEIPIAKAAMEKVFQRKIQSPEESTFPKRSKSNPDFPSFFTPNGDGYHDIWIPNNPTRGKVEVIYIFDRYGKLLTELSKGKGWDGKVKGRPLPSDDYWFLAKMNDLSDYHGNFSLIRK